jgi:alpha 1,2-mannosyltransferase
MLLRRGRYLLFFACLLTCVVTIHLYRTRYSTTDFEDVGILKPLIPPTHAELLEDIPSKPTEESQVEDSQRELQLLPELYDVDFPDRKLPAVLRTAQHAELASRLHAFLSRPILSHAAAAAQNERQCPLRISDLMVNPDQLNGDGPFWRDEVDESMIIEKRADLVSWLAQQASKGEEIVGGLQGGHSTRGIVVTGGNQVCRLAQLTLLLT